MAGTKEIKRRIRSTKSTKKITKAMELVSASKMKRAVASTLRSRLYAEYSWEILTSIAKNGGEINHPLFGGSKDEQKTSNKILLLLVTSNRGLCGAYNAQIIKKSISLIKELASVAGKVEGVDIIAIGKKGDVAMRRTSQNIIASFFDLPDNISISDIAPISEFIINEYSAHKYNRVLVAYTDFHSALTQKPNIKQVLPISKFELKEFIEEMATIEAESANEVTTKESATDYIFEGDKDKMIGMLAEKMARMQVYQMLLESNASEQSARMIAMKNASEASGEMIDDLTLVFNKARQANITREISEISAGMVSVN